MKHKLRGYAKADDRISNLVYLANRHPAAGSTVTESKLLVDSGGDEREVDVCIESNVGGIPLTICIECREGGRPATVEWVERMKGKHDDLPTDVLILYSSSGFTKGAIEKAKKFRKRIVALETLDEDSAERLFNGANLLSFKTSAQTANKVVIGLSASDGLPANQETFLLPADNTIAIFNESGQEISNLETLVTQILRSPRVLYQCLQTCQDHHKNFSVHSQSITEGPGNPIFLRHDGPDIRTLRRIESLTISGDVAVKLSPLPLKHGKLDTTSVAWGTVPYEGEQALIVASKDKTGIEKASFHSDRISVELQKGPPP
jgi:hypothetical protein